MGRGKKKFMKNVYKTTTKNPPYNSSPSCKKKKSKNSPFFSYKNRRRGRWSASYGIDLAALHKSIACPIKIIPSGSECFIFTNMSTEKKRHSSAVGWNFQGNEFSFGMKILSRMENEWGIGLDLRVTLFCPNKVYCNMCVWSLSVSASLGFEQLNRYSTNRSKQELWVQKSTLQLQFLHTDNNYTFQRLDFDKLG